MELPRVTTEPPLGHRSQLWARAPASRRALVANGVLSLAVAAAAVAFVEGFAAEHASSPPVVRRQPVPHEGLSALPLAAQGVVSATLGASDPAYRVGVAGTVLRVRNPAQGLSMRFDGRGVSIDAGRLHARLRLLAFGYGDSLQPVGEVRPRARANEATYARSGLREWYRNGPIGLEQGFTIPRSPRTRGLGPLTLSLALADNAGTTPAAGAGGFTLGGLGGESLRYGDLLALDARGRSLPCRLELHGDTVRMRVDVRGARYPLRIDPLIQLGAKLTEHEEHWVGPNFGGAVALSADGSTALIGAPNSVAGGAVWVFTRSGAGWSQQSPELTPDTALSPAAGFGASVALSANGNIALIGAPGEQGAHERDGSAWVFIRVNETWTEGPHLIDREEDEHAAFGASVALSANGDTALIGGFGDKSTGAAWVFVRSGATWVQQAKIVGSEGEGWFSGGGAGVSVALSAEGNTALIGSREDFSVWMFTRSGSTWTQSAGFDNGRRLYGFFGSSVALSADGNTVLAAEPAFRGLELFFGAAWVFTRVGSTWTTGHELTSVGSGTTAFGSSVALSGDGDTALVGSGQDDNGRGAAWVFRRNGSSWTEKTPQLTGGEEENGAAAFGASVALSGDGNSALVGGPNDVPLMGAPGSEGAVWAFTSAPPSATTSGASNVGTGTATLNAEVDPDGLATSAFFQYGTTTAYGHSTTALSAGSAEGASSFVSNVSGLAPATTYHFRVVAESSAGPSDGADQAFTTAPVVPVIPPPVAPVSRVAPAISGTPIRGQALSVSQGAWANAPTSFSYEWQSCDAAGHGCTALPGATGPTYVLRQGDVGRRLLAIVTATNAGGSNTATSAASPLVGSLVEATTTWTFGRSSRYTIVESLIVKDIPYEGTVEVVCHGRGCPFARSHAAHTRSRARCHRRCKTARPPSPQAEVDLTPLFKGRHLGVGTHITVNVAKAGWIGKSFTFTMRANHAPHLQIACLAPGSSQPGRGC